MEQPDPRPPALLVAGPTASGKSALALALARAANGIVINADSMQVYRELRVLTARPTPEDEAAAPHALYGLRPAAGAASVAWWRDAALVAMADATAAGRLPILCGGTGLYLRALTHGLSALPSVTTEARTEARARLAADGAAALHAQLAGADPVTAARLRPTDPQRLARALEVLLSTGRGLASWQDDARASPPASYAFFAVHLDPPRDALRAAIGRRWYAMVRGGAVEEVRALLDLGLDPSLPAMRAHGVPELSAMLRGAITDVEAGRRATLAVGQYTKRQATWFRHRPLADPSRTHSIYARMGEDAQFMESQIIEIMRKFRIPR